jgi:hypothetical protein
VSPSPLYNGTTLLLRQAYGANYITAELFKNDVKTGMASSPSHFKHYNGNELRPVLLFGLK